MPFQCCDSTGLVDPNLLPLDISTCDSQMSTNDDQWSLDNPRISADSRVSYVAPHGIQSTPAHEPSDTHERSRSEYYDPVKEAVRQNQDLNHRAPPTIGQAHWPPTDATSGPNPSNTADFSVVHASTSGSEPSGDVNLAQANKPVRFVFQSCKPTDSPTNPDPANPYSHSGGSDDVKWQPPYNPNDPNDPVNLLHPLPACEHCRNQKTPRGNSRRLCARFDPSCLFTKRRSDDRTPNALTYLATDPPETMQYSDRSRKGANRGSAITRARSASAHIQSTGDRGSPLCESCRKAGRDTCHRGFKYCDNFWRKDPSRN